MVAASSLTGYAQEILRHGNASALDRVEIGLDRHLSKEQCQTFFPGQYACVPFQKHTRRHHI